MLTRRGRGCHGKLFVAAVEVERLASARSRPCVELIPGLERSPGLADAGGERRWLIGLDCSEHIDRMIARVVLSRASRMPLSFRDGPLLGHDRRSGTIGEIPDSLDCADESCIR